MNAQLQEEEIKVRSIGGDFYDGLVLQHLTGKCSCAYFLVCVNSMGIYIIQRIPEEGRGSVVIYIYIYY